MPTISKVLARTPDCEILTVAGGCFSGIEELYLQCFNDRIIDCEVGFANGKTAHPTYDSVCKGDTGHTEAVQVAYDPSLVSFEELLEFFFRIHDATVVNTHGYQYRSVVFYQDDDQKARVTEVMKEVQKKWYPKDKLITVIEPLESFWDVDEYMQRYRAKNPSYVCHTHSLRTEPKL